LGCFHSSSTSHASKPLIERLEGEDQHAVGRIGQRLKKHNEIAFCTVASETVIDSHIMHFKDYCKWSFAVPKWITLVGVGLRRAL
jgi:hypothetical protein